MNAFARVTDLSADCTLLSVSTHMDDATFPGHGSAMTPAERLAAHPNPWNILCVSPLMERKVAETLGEAGLTVYVPIETYLPKPANVARSTRPWRPRTRPLIPGYVFCDLSGFCSLSGRAHLDIAKANHAVRRIMCQEGEPLTIPAREMSRMILDEEAGAFDSTRRASGARRGRRRGRKGSGSWESRWKSGQRVKVVDGPFAGFWGEVIRADREDRIEVLVTLFGRATPTQLDDGMIEGE